MNEPKKIPWEEVPDDVKRAICRLERKRIFRENNEEMVDRAEQEADRRSEEGL